MNIFTRIRNWFDPLVPAQDIKMRSHHARHVLIFARELIADRRRWTTGTEARRADGYECHPNSPDAACFCAFGAIQACSSGLGAHAAAAIQLAKAIDPNYASDRLPVMVIAGVNDKKGHKAILAAFDRAIAAS